MKKLEASAEENAPTFCLFKDYCSQAVGEKRALAMAMCIFRRLKTLVSVKSTTLTFTTGAIECFLLLKPM